MSNILLLTVSLIGAMLILIITFCLFIHLHNREKIWYKKICILGVMAAGLIAVFPLWILQNNYLLFSFIFSVFTAIKLFFISTDYAIYYAILKSQGDSVLIIVYEIFLAVLFFLAPLCTATIILSLIGDYLNYTKIHIRRYTSRYIFSELNEKSFSLASSMKNEGKVNGLYIFCGLNRSERNAHPLYTKTIQEGFYVVDKEILEIKPAHTKETKYYLISSNDDKNVDTALNLIEIYKGKKNILIVVLSNEKESEFLLDMKNAEQKNSKVDLLLLNEQRAMTLNLLFDNPLYNVLGPENNVSMLIIGGGVLGLEVLKSSLWCSRSGGKYSFDVTILDKNINLSSGRFTRDCPCISLNDYHISFHQQDINPETNNLLTFIDGNKGKFNYIVIATEDDEINIKTALDIKASYLRNQWSANISVAIRNDLKFCQMFNVSRKSEQSSVILFPFGNNTRMFQYNKLKNNIWEKYAKCINMIYTNTYKKNNGESTDISKEVCDSFWRDLSLQKKRSSRTLAVFLKYSLWLQGYKIDNKLGTDITFKDTRSDEQILEYAKIEHERWNTFTMVDGFFPWSYEDIKKLPKNARAIAEGNLHLVKTQMPEWRLHGCITDWYTLSQMDTELKTSFINYDIELTKHIPDIVSGFEGLLGYRTFIKKR